MRVQIVLNERLSKNNLFFIFTFDVLLYRLTVNNDKDDFEMMKRFQTSAENQNRDLVTSIG